MVGRLGLSLAGVATRTVASIIGWFTGGSFLGLFGLVAAGWLASIATIVDIALKNQKIKKVYKKEADTRLATQEAAALGIGRRGPGGQLKSVDTLAAQAADKLLVDEGDTEEFQAAMEMADLDIDDIRNAGGFTAEQAQKLFRARAEQRGIADVKRSFYEKHGEEGELVRKPSLFGPTRIYRRGISDADAKAENIDLTAREGPVNLEGDREISSDTEFFDKDAMAAIGDNSLGSMVSRAREQFGM